MNIIKKIKNSLRVRNEMNDIKQIRYVVLDHLRELIKRRKGIDDNLFEITAFLLDEIGDSLASIIKLREDHLKSSIMIARFILEDSVNLQYIYKADSEKRALNYRAFSAKGLLKRMEQSKEEDERIKGEIPRVKERVDKYSPSGNNPGHWDGRSVKDIMSDLGLDNIYSNWYMRMSSYIHPQYHGHKITADVDSPYINFLKDMVFKDLAMPILESLKVINEKLDLLEGGVIFRDYPKKKSTLIFSINNKRMK